MSVEDTHRSCVTRQAVVLLGFLITSGACARRDPDIRGAAGGANGSGAVSAATDLASAMTERSFQRDEPSRLLPVSNGLHAAQERAARSGALGATVMSFASAPQGDQAYALVDDDGDHRVDRVHAVTRGLDAFKWLTHRDGAATYGAELSRALGVDGFKARLDRSPKAVVVITDKLPARQRQGWRYVRFGAGGWLYIPVRVTHQA